MSMRNGKRNKRRIKMGKSAEKKLEAYQNRLAKRNFVPKDNPLTMGWMFNKWYEKIILFVLMGLGFWKIFELVFL